MGSEPVEELPDDLEAWVAERAAADDTSRADVVRRLMAAHRLLDEHPDQLDDGDGAAFGDEAPAHPADADIDDLEARIEELTGRVGELEADLDDKITDVRQRVIQVKREADAKAPADHDHPSIERRMDEGFENYEEVLEYLTERTEALEEAADDRSGKLQTVANAVVDLRRRVATLEGEAEKRAAVAELRETANQRGISTAACGSCGESVRLGLLDEPACPHCDSPFDGVEPGGWFRSNQLTVGNRPALESGPAPARADGSAGPTGPASESDGSGGTDPSPEPTGDDSRTTDAGERGSGPDPSETAGDGAHGDSASDPDADGFAGTTADGDDGGADR